MKSLKGEGEGKGRLSLGEHQYLFSFEAVLKENTDWLLAVAIPLHGEELLVLPALRDQKVTAPSTPESFDARIETGLSQVLKQSPGLAKNFSYEWRSLMRLILSEQLKLDRNCSAAEGSKSFHCQVGQETFEVSVSDKDLRLKKSLQGDYVLELTAHNLTGSFFHRTLFSLRKGTSLGTSALMTLELFWK